MKQAIWHPFTQHALAGLPVSVSRAEGAYLYAADGRAILDGISSWWVNTHGHCHPAIVEAVRAQAARLDQVIFAGFTHDAAEALAEKLLGLAGPSFAHVFFSDSGSTSVEAALKMALGYWEHTGMPRRKIAALEHGYHGDTFGAMSAGGRSVFNRLYEPYLFQVEHLAFPEKGFEEKTISAFRAFLDRNENDVAALIVEPLVLGAAGMKMYSAETLEALYSLCRERGVLFIADEVMTGWGRTGTIFACDQAGIRPDILCLSKGLTGGFLPMGATLCRAEIYDAFYKKDRAKMFFHSSSYTGNALASAAALASLRVWEKEPVFERIAGIAAAHRRAVQSFSQRGDVENVRQTGTIFALDVRDGRGQDKGYLSESAPFLYEFFMRHNLLLRPIGNSVYIMPPYCIKREELEHVYDVIGLALDALRDERKQRAA